ncbi:MAG TPA: 3-deoxy-7-phosphoheptulonate synthase [Acidimicrobiales bacterium]|nr:3-deoxy-7-phosphoheptulonate synthase [Acidimicrobiales bacterium]
MPPQPPIQNRRITTIRPLASPSQLRLDLPLSSPAGEALARHRQTVAAILNGTDDRMLVIVGPCSLHDPLAGLEYAHRLAAVAARAERELFIVMRTYFEKPRTTVGWKGLINDPGLDGSFRVNEGLLAARRFLMDTIALGLPVGCEFLDPITAAYLADTVSWGAIGARTTQSQIHRQLASGLSMPVGFKNAPDGNVQSAVDAVAAAACAQVFPGIDDDGRAAIFETAGNPDAHVVLRGSSSGPNYDEPHVEDALGRLERSGLPRRVIIDASHANSGKQHDRQPVVATDIAARVAAGETGIVGLMLESFLVAGRQDLVAGDAAHLVFGQSITDACLGWETTESVLSELAAAVARRRELAAMAAPG